MKKTMAFAAILSLGLSGLSIPAFTEQQSKYKVDFEVPKYINLSLSDIVPVKIKITTPDGKPYSGKVIMYTAGSAKIMGAKTAHDFVDLDAVDGEVSIKTEFDCHTGTRLLIGIYKSRQEPIGTIETPVHHIDIDTYDFLPEQSKLAVPTDGKTSPTLLIRIKDEAGNPVKGVRVRADHSVQTSTAPTPQTYMYAVTDENGIAKFTYPPSKIVQLESTQAVVPAGDTDYVILVSSRATLFYHDNKKPKMVSLKKAVERIKDATYTWDSTNRTMAVKGVSRFADNTMTFKEGTQFVTDGSMIRGLEAPIVRKGDDLLVPEGLENWIY